MKPFEHKDGEEREDLVKLNTRAIVVLSWGNYGTFAQIETSQSPLDTLSVDRVLLEST